MSNETKKRVVTTTAQRHENFISDIKALNKPSITVVEIEALATKHFTTKGSGTSVPMETKVENGVELYKCPRLGEFFPKNEMVIKSDKPLYSILSNTMLTNIKAQVKTAMNEAMSDDDATSTKGFTLARKLNKVINDGKIYVDAKLKADAVAQLKAEKAKEDTKEA